MIFKVIIIAIIVVILNAGIAIADGKQRPELDCLLNKDVVIIQGKSEMDLRLRKIYFEQPPDAVYPGIEGMADKDEKFNSTDDISKRIPTRRLIFSGKCSDYYFIFYEQGGLAYSRNVDFYMNDGQALKPVKNYRIAGRYVETENLTSLRNYFQGKNWQESSY